MASKTRMWYINAINDGYEFIKDFFVQYSDACKQYGGNREQREIEANLSFLVSNMEKQEYYDALREMDREGLKHYYLTVISPLVVKLQDSRITTNGNTETVSVNRFDDRSTHGQAGVIEENTADWKPSVAQWSELSSPSFYRQEKYKATRKNASSNEPINDLNELASSCNTFIGDVLRKFGDNVFNDILPNGVESPNVLFEAWKENENLEYLGSTDVAWVEALSAADDGYLVLSAASNNRNHVAFLLPQIHATKFDPWPKTDWKQREGYDPPQGKVNYADINTQAKRYGPAFLQAGSYTGIVSPRFAYSGEIVDEGWVHFFVYRGRKSEK